MALTPNERSDLRRELLRLAWPVVVQNLFRMTMFLADTFMIGRVGRDAMAALAIVWPIAHLILSVLMALSIGTVATVARAWGEGDREKQAREAATAVGIAAVLGLPLSALGVLLMPMAAGFFSLPGSPEVTGMAAGYLRFQGAALLFVCIDFSAAAVLRGAGNTRVPMMAAVAANVLNIFLNWVFIFGNLGAPRMGVAGAGLATAIAVTVQACLTFGYLVSPLSPLRLRASSFRLVSRESLTRFARVTLPAAVEPVILNAGFIITAKYVATLGLTALAAHRAAIAIESLAFMPGLAFAMAGSALVGQSLGAGRPDKAEAAFRECARTAAWLMSGIGILFLLFPTALVGLFLRGPGTESVLPLAAACLAISALEQPFLALTMSSVGALRGAGDTRTPLVVASIGVWAVRIPVSWLLAFPAGLGLHGIWITMIGDWLVRAAIYAVVMRRGKWKGVSL